jgi:hypothetical protein
MEPMYGRMTEQEFAKASEELAKDILNLMGEAARKRKASAAVCAEAMAGVFASMAYTMMGDKAAGEAYEAFQEIYAEIWGRHKIRPELQAQAIVNGYIPKEAAECGPPEPGTKAWGTWGRDGESTVQRFLTLPMTMVAKAGRR